MATRRSTRVGGRLILTLVLLPAWTYPGFGQEVAGSLTGRVLDPANDPQIDAHVAASGVNLLGSRATRTDKNGFFRVLALPPGDYNVRISRIGIRPVVVE